ncbi:MAG TPA: AlkA N-terminal domain-containing protein [Candidatus Saccharimonadaceae bacterium]|jgi:AraC family transcriptional regulator of adaptative response / DNA-3-methyladenine glycosylase II|nr:AlkA N-terminal domain-containing protein [Candidatus Saccharimonadaceae bacterium]
MELDARACYEAFAARDRRFDGRFVTAVVTTGVYCRPGCPAPLPRPRNVRFYRCAAAAEEAGFRPCLRCRPETSPGAPAWNGTSSTVSRALRLIEAGALDDAGVDALAERLGVGDRHLRRLFDEHLGASPLAVAQTRRAHFARRLIDDTTLGMAEIAMASGFPSVRRFNATMRDTFRRTPRELRASRAPHTKRNAAADALTLRVPFRAPFDWDALLEYVAGRAIPGVECVERGVWRRAIVHAGSMGLLEVSRSAEEPALELRVALPEPRDLIGLVTRVSRVFDVAADATSIARHLRRDALLKRAVSLARGVRVPGAWDPFELAVRAILGQQVSVKGATTIAGRVARTYGAPYAGPAADGITHQFPTPAALADAPLESVGLTRARAATVRGLAAAVATGALDFSRLGTLDDAVTALTALPGIGPWTAHYVAMRALGEPDALPAADLGLRRVLGTGGRLASPADVEARAEAWRPWRSYAVLALWRHEGASAE